jgi:hypothetical protein
MGVARQCYISQGLKQNRHVMRRDWQNNGIGRKPSGGQPTIITKKGEKRELAGIATTVAVD